MVLQKWFLYLLQVIHFEINKVLHVIRYDVPISKINDTEAQESEGVLKEVTQK